MEIVHDGWLRKSPPPKRLWRAKWRNRWFVLRSGELPGQYFLEYYTDDTRKKLKGKIDLDQCEQVDAGITFAHCDFDCKFMFDIKTPKRVYYLCAESEEAMNRWVDCVCQVCGLKVMNQEDMADPLAQLQQQQQYPSPSSTPSTPQTSIPPMSFDSHHRFILEYPSTTELPSPSSASTISGPYIPISECITGKKASGAGSSTTHFPFTLQNAYGDGQLPGPQQQRSSIPNQMAPPAPSDRSPLNIQSPSASGPAEGFYVLLTDEDKALVPLDHREDPEGKETLTKNKILSNTDPDVGGEGTIPPFAAPPRPPKPPHLSETMPQNYMNMVTLIKASSGKNSSGVNNEKARTGGVPQEGTVPSSDHEPSPVSSGSISGVTKNLSEETPDLHLSKTERAIGTSPLPPGGVSLPSGERTRRYGFINNVQGKFFSYDVHHPTHLQYHLDGSGFGEKLHSDTDPRISPHSIYSNVPLGPPAVDRGLKPKKQGESTNPGASELSPSTSASSMSVFDVPSATGGGALTSPASAPPIVDRNLKPQKKISDPISLNTPFVLDPAPRSKLRNHDQRKTCAAPSPTLPSLKNGRGNTSSDTDVDSSLSSPNSRRDSIADEQIQYLDLDLESHQGPPGSPKGAKSTGGVPKLVALEPSVVYKKVDFVKTEALNQMRQNVEKSYRTGKTTN